MRASELVAALQKALALHGDLDVGVIMDGDQRKTADRINALWPLFVSDRAAMIMLDCSSVPMPE